jgi:replicative DNA helicase
MSILQTAQRGNGLSPLYPHGNEPRAPYNLEAEQALLGALLINNQAAEYVSELSASHFYEEIHGRIFDAMSEMLLAGRTFTATTLAEKFRPYQINETTNGAQYLGRLMASATTLMNVREYARIIIEASQRRQLILLAEDLAARAFDPNDPAKPSELIEEAEKRLFQAAGKSSNGKEFAYADVIQMAVDAANKAYQTHGENDGVQTGFVDLDAKLGGLSNGNLIILAGRPSMGKTALALNIAANVAKTGDHVHFFSQEMTALELGQRQLSEQSEIASDRLRRGQFDENDFRKLSEAARRLSGLSMTIDETGANTIGAIATKARRIKRKKRTKLIIIDYLQIMGTASKGGNRVNDITEITVGLKALAKELDVPIIALSQLNRELEKRENKRPQLSDLRESGSIEQDADVVMFVFRDEYYIERTMPDEADPKFGEWLTKMSKAAGKAEVIIGKQRHGSVGTVTMAFDGARTRFCDLAHEATS